MLSINRKISVLDKVNEEYMEIEKSHRYKIGQIESQIFRVGDLEKIQKELPKMDKINLLREK